MSENKISVGYNSPDRELSTRDIKRKEDKLKKTKDKLKLKTLSARRRHHLEFKKLKTEDQIDTGLSGIRPIKTPFKLKHQKSSPLNHVGGNKHPHDNRYPGGHPPKKKSRKGSVQWYIDQQNQKDKEKRNN